MRVVTFVRLRDECGLYAPLHGSRCCRISRITYKRSVLVQYATAD